MGSPESSSHQCCLRILSDVKLQGLGTGLRYQRGELELDPKIFGCCQGAGRIVGDQGVRVCDLQKRFVTAQKVFGLGLELFGEPTLRAQILAMPVEEDLHLLGTKGAAGKRGRVIHLAQAAKRAGTEKDNDGTLSLWSVAFFATWRLGFKVRWYQFGTVVPKIDASDPDLLLVDGVQELWRPERQSELEAIVGEAYNGMLPLWISFVSKGGAPGVPSSFSGHIAKIRERTLGEWLGPSAAAKLQEVCVTGAVAPPSKPKRPPSVRLPWDAKA